MDIISMDIILITGVTGVVMDRCCITRVKTTSIITDGTTITLQLPQLALNNKQKLRICIAQDIPAGSLPVQLQFQNVPILTMVRRCGTAVISDQLRPNRFYDVVIGTNSKIAVILNPQTLCNTCYTFPQLLPTTATATNPTLNKTTKI